MRSGAEAPVIEHSTLDTVPPDAMALFGTGLNDTATWYRTVADAAVAPGASACFLTVGSPPIAVLPMLRWPGATAALTTPYTCRWAPLTAPSADGPSLRLVGHALGSWCLRTATTRLDALDLDDSRWRPLCAGIRAAGLVPLRFAHFGNWHSSVAGLDWNAYLAARPGALRATLHRRGARLQAAGATCRVVTDTKELPDAIDSYERVYERSWKGPEPFPAFNPALMRACAADGTLRLGLLQLAGETVAAQFWVVRDGTATVLKLAHDTAHDGASPGTVLTGMMIRHVLQRDRVLALDFGRGDDEYKRDWTGTRRQLHGLLLVNPRRLGGLVELVKHALKKARSMS
jgi:hypothetical protein